MQAPRLALIKAVHMSWKNICDDCSSKVNPDGPFRLVRVGTQAAPKKTARSPARFCNGPTPASIASGTRKSGGIDK